MQSEKKYSIKAVSQLTGLSEYVIRAWEKRYSAVTPSRTETNRRVYSFKDVEKLNLLHEATMKGHSIGNVADLSIESLKDLIGQIKSQSLRYGTSNNQNINSNPSTHLENCLEAIQNLDSTKFEKELLRASVNLSQPVLFEELLIPLLEKIGQNWQEGVYRVVNEHMASTIVGAFLSNLRDSHKISDSAPKILFTTPTGQYHEFGALLAAATAASLGWKVIYLGPNLPITDFMAAAEQLNAKAVAFSLIYPPNDSQLKKELDKLKVMRKDIAIIAGGRVADTYINTLNELGAYLANDMNDFKDVLNTLIKEKIN